MTLCITGSGAAEVPHTSPTPLGTPGLTAASAAAPACTDARKGLRYYRRQTAFLRSKMGQESPRLSSGASPAGSCPAIRNQAKRWRTKARNARLRYERWHTWHYAWWKWLPEKFARVGACETGYGRRPGNWAWDSGTYVSAFGIYRPAYAQFAHATGTPSWDAPGHRTPREQFIVASAIQARFGWGAWGCGGA